MVNGVGGVGINNLEAVEGGAKEGLIGGDGEGENIVQLPKAGKHRIVGEKRHMNVGGHGWLPNRGKE